MTRKDYVLIANVLKDSKPIMPTGSHATVHKAVAGKLADALATDNPAFNRARFLEACGV